MLLWEQRPGLILTFQQLQKDRPDGYGGVLVAVKDLTCQELGDLSSFSKLQKKSGNSLMLLGGDFNLGGDMCWGSNTIAIDSQYSTACEKLKAPGRS